MSKNLKKLPKQKRDHFIPPTRVTADEFACWQDKVRESGVSPSAYRRAVLLDDDVVHKQSGDVMGAQTLNREAVYQLLALGRNINQIAKVLHIILRDFKGVDGYDAVRINTTLGHCDDALKQIEAPTLDLMR